MAESGTRVSLNGAELWGYAVEVADGLRLRFALGDWERMGLREGQRVWVRLPGKADVQRFVTAVTPLPPVVSVTLAQRIGVGARYFV